MNNQMKLNELKIQNMKYISKYRNQKANNIIASEQNEPEPLKFFGNDKTDDLQRDYVHEAEELLKKYIADTNFIKKLLDEDLTINQIKKLVTNFPFIKSEFFEKLRNERLNKSDFIEALKDLINEKIIKTTENTYDFNDEEKYENDEKKDNNDSLNESSFDLNNTFAVHPEDLPPPLESDEQEDLPPPLESDKQDENNNLSLYQDAFYDYLQELQNDDDKENYNKLKKFVEFNKSLKTKLPNFENFADIDINKFDENELILILNWINDGGPDIQDTRPKRIVGNPKASILNVMSEYLKVKNKENEQKYNDLKTFIISISGKIPTKKHPVMYTYSTAKSNKYYANLNSKLLDEFTQNQLNQIVNWLENREEYAETTGSGLKLKSNAIHDLGKYYLEKNKFANNILELRYKKNKHLTEIKPIYLNHLMKSIITDMITKKQFNINDYHKLNEFDKNTVRLLNHKFGLGINVHSNDNLDKRFEIIRGEIDAGNDNKALLREAKTYILHAIRTGKMSRNVGYDLIHELNL
jgi:hypothetical protein